MAASARLIALRAEEFRFVGNSPRFHLTRDSAAPARALCADTMEPERAADKGLDAIDVNPGAWHEDLPEGWCARNLCVVCLSLEPDLPARVEYHPEPPEEEVPE